jgi:hypothetical protein
VIASKVFAASAFALAVGCSVQTDPAPAAVIVPTTPSPTTGSVTFEWTINGTMDPNQCVLANAESIAIDIDLPDAPAGAGSYRQTCALFATSIALGPGTYSARALLVDAAGASRTTILQVDPFTVLANGDIRIPIDFPSASFF